MDDELPDVTPGVERALQRAENERVHFVELLDRVAEFVDPDVTSHWTYEQRLDWLAKWREVVGR